MKTKKIKANVAVLTQAQNADWPLAEFDSQEAELAIDVYQDEKNVYLSSTIAGVEPQNLEISLNNDLLTIRGVRHEDGAVEKKDYFLQECYWGGFSRSVILPVEVSAQGVVATLKNGVLTITLPKLTRQTNIPIKVT